MNDFDFFTGTWDIANRWRTNFLDPGSEWEEFPGVSDASRHFDGNANFDEIIFPTKGFSGLTLRFCTLQPGHHSGRCTGPANGPARCSRRLPEHSRTESANSSARTPTTTCPYSPGSDGQTSQSARPTGSRPSPPTAAIPGLDNWRWRDATKLTPDRPAGSGVAGWPGRRSCARPGQRRSDDRHISTTACWPNDPAHAHRDPGRSPLQRPARPSRR